MKTNYVTALPLVQADAYLELALKDDSELLANDYKVIKREGITALGDFEDSFNDDSDVMTATGADLFIIVSKECSPSILQPDTNIEKIERFLLALNIIGKLWHLGRTIRLNWPEGDESQTWKHIRKMEADYYSASFDGEVNIEDLRKAAALTVRIDKVYAENDEKRGFPSVRVAFDALRLSSTAFNTSMRFLQEAIALETLCSTADSEVSHRVATTCGLFLASTLEERKEVYNSAKRLYGIRSRIIHGSGKRASIDDVKNIELMTRHLLRCVLDDSVFEHYRTQKLQKEFLLAMALQPARLINQSFTTTVKQ
jgi:Apea-like HEPN